MKKIIIILLLLLPVSLVAQIDTLFYDNGRIRVKVFLEENILYYTSVYLKNNTEIVSRKKVDIEGKVLNISKGNIIYPLIINTKKYSYHYIYSDDDGKLKFIKKKELNQ